MKQYSQLKLSIISFIILFLFSSSYGQTVERLYCKKVETSACFPGGDADWKLYLLKSINSEIPYIYCAPPGKYNVEVRFLIERNGDVCDIKPLTKVGFGMEEELIRIIHNSPDWTPATQNGRNVREYKRVTFTFNVSQREFIFL